MSPVIENLRSLDRKERFAVLREALGFHPETPRLDGCFRTRLSECIGTDVPECAFLAMDYHLDWIQLALHFAETPDIEPGSPFPRNGFGDINKDPEDIDLLVAFEQPAADSPKTHLVLIEAKAYLPWTNKQLKSKVRRLAAIFGAEGKRHATVCPHFVLMTGRISEKIRTKCWPDWTKTGDEPFWLEYALPRRRKVTRCTDTGTPARGGDHLCIRCVPTPE